MANLHQLNISYDPLEDRLLLKMTTRGGESDDEFRFWLTRRFVKLLWQSLDQMVVASVAANPAVATAHQESIVRFQEEAALQQSDFSTPYAPPVVTQVPLGEEPLLATKIRLRRQPDNNHTLSLQQQNGLGVNLALNSTTLHALRKILQDGIKMAQWNLNLRISPGAAAEQVMVTEPRLIQ